MIRLWEQNRPLVFVAGGCLLLLVVIRPTVFDMGPPLARWMGTNWKAAYDELELQRKDLEGQLEEFYPRVGGEAISDTQAKVEQSNARLRQNFGEYIHALVFVPYRPYVPPMDKAESAWGPYFRGVLIATHDALLQYCSFRFVQVSEDLGFGEFEKGEVPADKDRVTALLRELAVVETFVRHCADCQVEYTKIVSRGPRRPVAAPDRSFIWEYPMQVKLRVGYRELMKLLGALNGHHGVVTAVQDNELRDVVERVTLNLGRVQGVRRDDSFTLFKRSSDKPCDLRYAGRVTVTSVSETECVARVEEESLPYDRLDAAGKEAYRIQRGDFASGGFLRVLKIDVKGVPGSVEGKDSDGVPTKVTPHMLDVALDVSTLGFEPGTEYVTAKNVKGAGPVVRKRPPVGTTPTTTGSGVPTKGSGLLRSF